MEFDEKQLKAINLCSDMSKRIVAVTGEAGTGKTTIIKEVYKRFVDYIENNKDLFGIKKTDPVINEDFIVLVAPTGKAAKRIYEATGIPAMTIHRLLEYPSPGEVDEDTGKPITSTSPKRDRKNPIKQKIVLCDEYAMVSYELHRNLIDALPRGGVIRMFGDCNQLEPIEESKVLKNKPSQFQEMLIKFPCVILDQIHRQENGSSIIENSHNINRGLMPKRTDDFKLYFTNEKLYPTTIISKILEEDEGYYTSEKQIISPTKKSWIGTDKLNSMIQLKRFSELYDEGYPIDRHKWSLIQDFRLFIGDKIIFCKNNYNLGIFNGETGIVINADRYGDVVVDFGDKIVTIPNKQQIVLYGKTVEYNPQKDIELAYVITTHKSQGSEYKEVIYVIDRSAIYMCSRKNLYTAVTRAKQKVNIISDQRTLIFALKNVVNPYCAKGAN